jgi:methyltransferase
MCLFYICVSFPIPYIIHLSHIFFFCKIRNSIEQRLQPGIRCTVQLDPLSYGRPGQILGKVVSPSTVTHSDGTYWGYTVRIATSMKAIFDECPYPEAKYDLIIGTSERGNESIDDPNFTLQKRHVNKSSGSYRHALIVFGGVAGIEECIDADESIIISGSNCYTMFDKWINICPYQGSRTIRSEEAVLITLAKLNPFLINAVQTTSGQNRISNDTPSIEHTIENAKLLPVPFDKDEQLSDESSDQEE